MHSIESVQMHRGSPGWFFPMALVSLSPEEHGDLEAKWEEQSTFKTLLKGEDETKN